MFRSSPRLTLGHLFKVSYRRTLIISSYLRFIALSFTLFHLLRTLTNSFTEESNFKELAIGRRSHKEAFDKLEQLTQLRYAVILNIIKTLGDMIPSSNRANLPLRLLGKKFALKWIGIGGVSSACVSILQIWRKLA